MPITYTKTDQGTRITTGTGAPTHSAVAGDRYTDTATGNTYQYTTSWQQVAYGAGGLTYFTEAQSTASPNATVNVDSLTAVASTTDADFSILPKGNGALISQIPDSTTAGGNKRGIRAVDFQRNRAGATQVASGNESFIGGGSENMASGSQSTSIGGYRNYATSTGATTLGGYQNTANGSYSATIGGQLNQTNNSYAVSGGYSSQANGNSSIALGYFSTATSSGSIALGSNSYANNTSAVAIAGGNATGAYSFAIGNNNLATSDSSVAMGVYANTYSVQNKLAFGTSGFGATGTSQYGKMVLVCATSSDAYVELAAQNTPSDARYNLTLQNNQAMRVKGSIIGKQTASTNVAAWDFDYVIVRGASVGTTTVVTSNINVVSNIPAWGTPTITADIARGYASIKVSGIAATNIRWVANIDSIEVVNA